MNAEPPIARFQMEHQPRRPGYARRSVPMNCTEIKELPDFELVYVHGAIVSVLAKFLDPLIPWVWILGHRPNQYIEWWKTTVPLNCSGSVLPVRYAACVLTYNYQHMISSYVPQNSMSMVWC